jgi:hypothetical protein
LLVADQQAMQAPITLFLLSIFEMSPWGYFISEFALECSTAWK